MKKTRKISLILLILLLISTFTGCDVSENNIEDKIENNIENKVEGIENKAEEKIENITGDKENFESVQGNLEVHFIDVGQADCSLLISDDDTMLIDGGNVSDGSLIITYLTRLGIDELDYVVCTHAHEDHVGGLSAPLHKFEVDTVYAPKTSSDTKAYKNFREKALNADEYKNPRVGETIELGDCKITFLAPVTEDYEDLNNTSIVLKAQFGATSFLFTGDAERDSEIDMIENGADLKADVLKVGHHGSETSSSYRFLNEVMPKYAVISVGKDNSYGHPNEAVLSRFSDLGATVYRTDEMGDIIATSDGKNITFKTGTKPQKNVQTKPVVPQQTVQKTENVESEYIGNKNSEIFHRTTCSSLPKESNRVYFSSRATAISENFRPCKNCNP